MSQSKAQGCEIAEKLVRHILQERGISTLKPNHLRRYLGNIAKEIDVDLEDLVEFVQPIYKDLLKEVFKNDRS